MNEKEINLPRPESRGCVSANDRSTTLGVSIQLHNITGHSLRPASTNHLPPLLDPSLILQLDAHTNSEVLVHFRHAIDFFRVRFSSFYHSRSYYVAVSRRQDRKSV